MGHEKAYDEPSEVDAEEGVVVVDGPDAVAVTFTPDAAAETSQRLLLGSAKAQGQRVESERRRRRAGAEDA
jgi:hypothetical protein